jgi:hypothetical protein
MLASTSFAGYHRKMSHEFGGINHGEKEPNYGYSPEFTEQMRLIDQGLCPDGEYKGQPCMCSNCPHENECIDAACDACDGPVLECDPTEDS